MKEGTTQVSGGKSKSGSGVLGSRTSWGHWRETRKDAEAGMEVARSSLGETWVWRLRKSTDFTPSEKEPFGEL